MALQLNNYEMISIHLHFLPSIIYLISGDICLMSGDICLMSGDDVTMKHFVTDLTHKLFQLSIFRYNCQE